MYNNYLIQRETKKESCVFCKYYKQHYVKCGTQYISCFAGHCINKRMKNVKPDHRCENFESKKEGN